MLSIAVKNSLLVVLIILILHFMLKNYLIERDRQTFTNSPVKTVVHTEESATPIPSQIGESKSAEISFEPENPVKDADELYKFVFDDDPIELASNLGKMSSLGSAACDAPKQHIPDPATMKAAKNPQKQAINNNFLVLNEYDNESALNGGNIFGNLSGYDGIAGDYVAW